MVMSTLFGDALCYLSRADGWMLLFDAATLKFRLFAALGFHVGYNLRSLGKVLPALFLVILAKLT